MAYRHLLPVNLLLPHNHNIMKLEPNLSMPESMVRYGIMMIPVIIGGILGKLWIMLLGLPIFLTAISFYCPLYDILGIDHSDGKKEKSGESQ